MAQLLPSGAFLGNVPRSRMWGGFSFAEVVDRAKQEIPIHTHSEAHFFFLLRGRYVTDADGIDGACGPSTLMFVPRWTTHRDHFATRGGSFFTVSVEAGALRRVVGDIRLSERAAAVTAPQCRQLMRRIHDELRNADEWSPAVTYADRQCGPGSMWGGLQPALGGMNPAPTYEPTAALAAARDRRDR